MMGEAWAEERLNGVGLEAQPTVHGEGVLGMRAGAG